ncbi:MAG: hypothetical protein ACLSAH_00890 [Bilophila wadsworthia]
MLLIADRHQRIADDTDDAFVFVNLADDLAHGHSKPFTNVASMPSMYSTERQHGFHHLLGMFEAAFLHAVAVTFLAPPLIGLPALRSMSATRSRAASSTALASRTAASEALSTRVPADGVTVSRSIKQSPLRCNLLQQQLLQTKPYRREPQATPTEHPQYSRRPVPSRRRAKERGK